MNESTEYEDTIPDITEEQLAEQRVNLVVVENERAAREVASREAREANATLERVNQRALEIEREARETLAAQERERKDMVRWRFFRAHWNTVIEDGLPLHRWIVRQDVQLSYGGLDGAMDKAMSVIR